MYICASPTLVLLLRRRRLLLFVLCASLGEACTMLVPPHVLHRVVDCAYGCDRVCFLSRRWGPERPVPGAVGRHRQMLLVITAPHSG